MYKTAYGVSPACLTDLISKHVPSRSLRSRDADLFYVPRTFSKYDDCRFGGGLMIAGLVQVWCEPLLWNNLPERIKKCQFWFSI